MNAIAIDGLTKMFGETTAVDDLSFAVEKGELFGLLGPNGASKSTLINMVCTLLRPTEGTATVNGYDITDETGEVTNDRSERVANTFETALFPFGFGEVGNDEGSRLLFRQRAPRESHRQR